MGAAAPARASVKPQGEARSGRMIRPSRTERRSLIRIIEERSGHLLSALTGRLCWRRPPRSPFNIGANFRCQPRTAVALRRSARANSSMREARKRTASSFEGDFFDEGPNGSRSYTDGICYIIPRICRGRSRHPTLHPALAMRNRRNSDAGKRSLTVLLKLLCVRYRAKPRLTSFHPKLICGRNADRRIAYSAQFDFCLSAFDGEETRTACGTELTALERLGRARCFKITLGPDAEICEGRTTLLSAIRAVTDTDADRLSFYREPYFAASTTSLSCRHSMSPQ